jgi:hypothetical protein
MTTETVAEIIGDKPSEPEEVVKVQPPRLGGQPPFPTPGIYFDMPEEEYHAIHACSASGLKHLSVSSMDYWAMSTLNQEREDETEKDSGKLTPRQLGHAYHSYIVEGEAAFNKRFVLALDKDEWRAKAKTTDRLLCITVADSRAALEALDIKPKGTAKDPLIEQLLEADPGAFVWDRMVSDHGRKHAGKAFISPKLFRRIAIAKLMIEGDPELKDAFNGGHAEVSIFWFCPTTGAPMKARLDYIKMQALVDLKSFGNQMGRPIQRAIDAAISNNKYFIPVVVYLEAIAAAKQMVRDTKGACICQYKITARDGRIEYERGQPTDNLTQWCWKWAHQPEPQVIFIFQQTGIAPVTRGRIMPTANIYMINNSAVQYLKRKWVRCALAYGTDPWLDFEPVMTTVDEELSWAATDFGDIA